MRVLLLAACAAALVPMQTQTTSTDPDAALKDFKIAYTKAGKDDSGREAAVRSLGRVPHAKTLHTLSAVLLGDGTGQEVSPVRIAAAETIGGNFGKIPNSWTPLATVARNRDRKITEIRIASVKAMKQLEAPASLRTLQDFIDDKPFEMAKEAVEALPLIPDKSSVPLLIKLLRDAERLPEDEIVPGLPFHGAGLAGPAIDDARAEQAARHQVLYTPVVESLKSLTGQTFTSFKEYQRWWSANGSSFQVQGRKGK